jgi:hypothetical protein
MKRSLEHRKGQAVAARVLRFFYLLALTITLFAGTLGLVVLATRVWHPGAASGQLERLAFGVYFCGVGLGGWAGLAYMFRRLMPLPCPVCGRAAKAASLNPVEVRCRSCGRTERLGLHVHGAS